MLTLEAGITPDELALSIAAALQYRNAADPAAVRLRQLVDAAGPAEALARIAGIESTGPLAVMVMRRYQEVIGLLHRRAAR